MTLLASKTRVLVTHKLDIISHAKQVVVMRAGRIECQGDSCTHLLIAVARAAPVRSFLCAGTYEYFTHSAVDLASYVSSVEQHVADSEAPAQGKGAGAAEAAAAAKGPSDKPSSVGADAGKAKGAPDSKLMTKEERATGAVQLKVRQAGPESAMA
jgi:energy-coupling factor transporter ATP-binding protein EcfA2